VRAVINDARAEDKLRNVEHELETLKAIAYPTEDQLGTIDMLTGVRDALRFALGRDEGPAGQIWTVVGSCDDIALLGEPTEEDPRWRYQDATSASFDWVTFEHPQGVDEGCPHAVGLAVARMLHPEEEYRHDEIHLFDALDVLEEGERHHDGSLCCLGR